MQHLSLFFLVIFLMACNNKRNTSFESEIIISGKGVSADTLNLIYEGPKGFSVEYFPNSIIKASHISSCEIVDGDSSSTRVTRKVIFDRNGNITKDDNNHFQHWFKGTVIGSYSYSYDSSNNLLKMIGITQKNGRDSFMTINNYNEWGQLYSRDQYRFRKKLKPGADRHLPSPKDFEKYPSWNKMMSYKFSQYLNTVIIETISDGKLAYTEKHIMEFDSLNKLQAITKYSDTSFVETTRYIYSSTSITGNLRRKMDDGTNWVYSSKSITDSKGKQTEKVVFKDDGSEKVKMIITYNADGTISSIRYDNDLQFFKYTYY